jgi:hypothetical protein
MTEYVVFRVDETLVGRSTRRQFSPWGVVEADNPKEAVEIINEEKGGGEVEKVANHPLNQEGFNAAAIASSNLHAYNEEDLTKFDESEYDRREHRKYEVFKGARKSPDFWHYGLGAGKNPAISIPEIVDTEVKQLTKTEDYEDADWMAFLPTNPSLFQAEGFEFDWED